jgi:D-alanyl-lipoteichoic acid acyltransferase DltB (MBOAT superfamily)
VSGFWHGANWTFIIWGALNAFYFLPLLLTNNNRKNLDAIGKDQFLPNFKDLSLMLLNFGLIVFTWIFFRAENVDHAFNYISEILSPSLFELPAFSGQSKALITTILIGVFLLIEWQGRENAYAIEKLVTSWRKTYRWSFYFVVLTTLFIFSGKEQQFIYFQF